MRVSFYQFILLTFLLILSSCQNPLSETGYSTTDLNVVSFSYKDAYTRGLVRNFMSIAPTNFDDKGFPPTCTIEPALPQGLSISSPDCVISGTPVALMPPTTYTVTALSRAGMSKANVSISVASSVPMLTYPSHTASRMMVQITINPVTLYDNGSPITNCTVTPALLTGLTLNPNTCVISGATPDYLLYRLYTVTVTNAIGSSESTFSLSVAATPLMSFNGISGAGQISLPFRAQPSVFNTRGEPVTSCTTTPALPAGLSINQSTCVISGTPTEVASGTYTVTATNAVGSSDANILINITPYPPLVTYSMGGFIGYISVPFVATPNLYEINGAPITSCTISPTLPNGLSIDPITCVVSGIPTVSIPQGNYTITVTNSAGVGYGTLPMMILPSVPVLSYAGVSGTGSFGSYLSITPSTLVNNGAWVTSCTISPALPSGLWMDNYTCSIFGTASQVIPLTTFTVTAANSAGVTTAQVPITIAPTPPNLSYEGAVGKTGFAQSSRTIIPRTFNYGGVSLTNCTISPALPTGLSIAPTSCVISGTALYESTTTTYTVTATNVAGTGSTTLDISVSPIPPTLSYSASTGTSGLAQNAMSITPSALNQGGTSITNCTITPALPSGLSLNTTTCVISGTPPNESPLTTYTVTIHNSAGTGTASVSLKVDPIPPTLSFVGSSGTSGNVGIGMSVTPSSLNAGGTTITNCVVSPALPSGLSLNTSTCVISGSPTVIWPMTPHTVTVYNSAGNGSATVMLFVAPSPPILSYVGSTGKTGFAQSPRTISPTNLDIRGAGVTSCTTSPALPTGLLINANTCVISGTALYESTTTTYTVTATNSAGPTTTTLDISVSPILPTISYATSSGKTGSAQSLMTVTPSTLNAGGTSITNCTVSPSLPGGLSINTSTCVISGTPPYESPLTTYTVIVTNSVGTHTTTVDLRVNAIPPTLSYAASTGKNGNVGIGMSVTPSSLNAGGTTIINCVVSPALPSGLSLNTSTCVISGSPTVIWSSTTHTVTVYNSAGNGSASLSLFVAPSPPILSYSGASGTTGNAQSARTISPTTLDIRGAGVSSCTSSPALPDGLSINQNTCVISGTPTTAQSSITYTITATNSAGSTTASVSMAVSAITPTISYTASTGNAQSSRTITPTINAGGSTVSNCTASLPAGLSIAPTTCVISGTPTTAQSATNYTVTITTAAGLSNTGTVSIAVSAITPTISYTASTGNAQSSRTITPTINAGGSTVSNCTASLPAGLSIAPLTCVISGTPTTAQSATNYTVTITTAAGLSNTGTVSIAVSAITPTISYTASTGNAQSSRTITPTINAGGSTVSNCTATLPAGLSIAPLTCVISGTPTTAQSATNHTVTITTAAGLSNTGTVSIAVSAITPTISYTASTGNAQSFRTITPTINAGGSTVSNCTASLPAGLSIAPLTCVISGTPTTAQSATNHTVTITTVAGLSNTGTVSIAVSAITPTISYSASTGNIHSSRTITPTVNAGGSTISNCTASLPAGLSIAPTTCIISGTPTASQTVTNHTVTVTTAAGLSNTGTVSITVSPIAPALSYASASGTVNSALTINPSNINNNGASITSCTTSGLPAGLSVNSSCVISGTPTTAGSASYTITATNSAGSTNATITITIAAIAPTLSYSGAGGTSGQVNTAMSISPTGLTTGGAPITNCTGTLPAGLNLNATTCVITGTPTWAQTATSHTITIRNSSNLTSTATVSITIAARLPTISFSGASTGNVGVARTITPTTYNGGTNISNCTISPALSAGLSISTSTCVISGTPSSVFGPNTYTVTIHNSAGTGTGTISISASGYICTSNGFDGPSGTVASINNCYYNCSARGKCGGTRYHPNTCYDQSYLYHYNCSQQYVCEDVLIGWGNPYVHNTTSYWGSYDGCNHSIAQWNIWLEQDRNACNSYFASDPTVTSYNCWIEFDTSWVRYCDDTCWNWCYTAPQPGHTNERRRSAIFFSMSQLNETPIYENQCFYKDVCGYSYGWVCQ